MTQECGVFRNRILLLCSWGQPKRMAVAFNVWEKVYSTVGLCPPPLCRVSSSSSNGSSSMPWSHGLVAVLAQPTVKWGGGDKNFLYLEMTCSFVPHSQAPCCAASLILLLSTAYANLFCYLFPQIPGNHFLEASSNKTCPFLLFQRYFMLCIQRYCRLISCSIVSP